MYSNAQQLKGRILDIQFLRKEDIYSLEKFFLSSLDESSDVNLYEVSELSNSVLGFVLMRGILYNLTFQNKMKLYINQKVLVQLIRSKKIKLLEEFFEFQSSLSLEKNETVETEKYFEEKLSFQLKDSTKGNTIFIGGGILKERIETYQFISEKIQELNLRNAKGQFFIRTNSNSFLYPINNLNKKNFFIQERPLFPSNFLFYHIKIQNANI